MRIKRGAKLCSRRHFIFLFYFYLPKKIGLDVSCESSASQRSYMKHQVLLSLKAMKMHLWMSSAVVVIGLKGLIFGHFQNSDRLITVLTVMRTGKAVHWHGKCSCWSMRVFYSNRRTSFSLTHLIYDLSCLKQRRRDVGCNNWKSKMNELMTKHIVII